MRLIRAKGAGFCFGVKNAVTKAMTNAGENVYCYGNIINNERVANRLAESGIKTVESIELVPDGATVIIRSHGAGKEIYELCRERGIKIIDATCPFVANIHKLAEKYYNEGYKICIVGDANHPEVKGINGWCGGEAEIISEEEETDRLTGYEKLCILVQTTFSATKYINIIKKIPKHQFKSLEIFDTICYTTVERQKEAEKIARNCTVVLVIGSSSSSNTDKLRQIAQRFCDRTYLVDDVSRLKNIKFTPDDSVGLLAGASTPEELIMEVINFMSQNFEEVQNQEFISGVEESLVSYKEGKKVKGTVILADEHGIRVNIGGKKDGLILKEEATIDGNYNPENFLPDSVVEAVIINKNDPDSGCVLLSKKKVDLIKEGDKKVDTIRNGEEFELVPEKDTKGGLLGKIGTYTVFIPASQIKERFVTDLKPFTKKKLRLVALEIDDAKHKIIASQRKILERERTEREEVFWANVKPDVIVSGVVKRYAPFGAFISVAGFDCLAHIVDISWKRIANIEEVLKIGSTYDFLVLSADREKGRVSLGYKQLQPHPFTVAIEKHPIGSVCKGKVVNIMPYGAFVEIEDGVEGLVHVSKAARNYVKDINTVLKVGDEVDVKVISIDEPNRKITLSIKDCLPEEEKTEEQPIVAEGETPAQAPAPKKERAPRAPKKTERKPKTEDDSQKEWTDETSNNPFADLLKNIEVENK